MKQLLTATAITLIFLSCTNSKTDNHSNSDTTQRQDKVVLMYRGLDSTFNTVYGYRIIKNQFGVSPTDSTRNEWRLDSFYFVPHPIQNPDSLKSGKVQFTPISKFLILDQGKENVDSLFKKYSLHLPKVDTANQ